MTRGRDVLSRLFLLQVLLSREMILTQSNLQGSPSNLRSYPRNCRREVRYRRRSEEHKVDGSFSFHLPPVLRSRSTQPSPLLHRLESSRRQVTTYSHAHREDSPRSRQLLLVRPERTLDVADELVRPGQRRGFRRLYRTRRHPGSGNRSPPRMDFSSRLDLPRSLPASQIPSTSSERRSSTSSSPHRSTSRTRTTRDSPRTMDGRTRWSRSRWIRRNWRWTNCYSIGYFVTRRQLSEVCRTRRSVCRSSQRSKKERRRTRIGSQLLRSPKSTARITYSSRGGREDDGSSRNIKRSLRNWIGNEEQGSLGRSFSSFDRFDDRGTLTHSEPFSTDHSSTSCNDHHDRGR